jgi:hypothetical protein
MRAKHIIRVIEGVEYEKYIVRYTLIGEGRHAMTIWSPRGGQYVRAEVARTLDARHGIEKIKSRSVTIQRA